MHDFELVGRHQGSLMHTKVSLGVNVSWLFNRLSARFC
jgi:hypothetical protein